MKIYTPLKAIRLKCLDCMCGSSNEAKRCPSESCTLYPYRLGHRPKKATYEGVTEDFDEGYIDTLPEEEN